MARLKPAPVRDLEKLGTFYLGRPYDIRQKEPRESLLLYDSRDLVTHAVCVGMTGSGKTGLCLCLLEEAAIDGIPALVIDPKGDLTNLLLTFPQLRPEDFAPWVNEDDARRRGITPQEYAREQAELWKNGLTEWGQDGARIQRLRDAADFAIYTPGSNAGLPVSVLRSFAAPRPTTIDDAEMLRDRTNGTASSLLGLLGLKADPIQSREHILVSTILGAAWKQGRDLDVAGLIQQIQNPPVTRIGVLDLESFFPSKDRFGLAMQINNLLAAPGFEVWMEGEPLDIGAMLHTPAGKPRVSIFSIAHLGDAERMFFVSLLLSQTLGWVRTQPGTTSLRALVYMDEIFGYFPPLSNPPSKAPLLTLLKQARAFGLGIVLATQNPVDLDYKGLANAGTWFIGRLQTERDKARVLEGLEGAAASQGAGFDRQRMEQILAGLGNRIFLINNVHEDAPEVFQARWALSYLCGPLTRNQIKTLMDPRKAPCAATAKAEAASTSAPAAAPTSPVSGSPAARPAALVRNGTAPRAPESTPLSPRSVLPPEIAQFFLPWRADPPSGSQLTYRPMLFGCGQVYFNDAKAGVDVQQDVSRVAPAGPEVVAIDWQLAVAVDVTEADLEKAPAEPASFAALSPAAAKAKSYDAWKKSLADWLFRNQKLELLRSRGLEQVSKPGESERDFRIRLQQTAREQRDQVVGKLRAKFAPKSAAFEERIRRGQLAAEREAEQAKQQKLQTAISFGATLLGAFVGRKAMSLSNVSKATTAMRGVSRSMKESQDVARAAENVGALRQQLADLEAQFQAETQALESKIDPLTESLEIVALKPKKTNVSVRLVALVWAPYWQHPDGTITSAWE